PPSAIASDAAALGYARPLSEHRNGDYRATRRVSDGCAGKAGTASKRHRRRRRCTWLRPTRFLSIGTATTGPLAAFRTDARAKPAPPPSGIASDAAALG